MKKQFTLTIGISALNEERNIGNLITDILGQKTKGITLKNIIIVSDGSTDKTTKIVSKIKNKLINLVVHRKRMGKYYRENEIFSKTNTDALIIFDADIRIKDPNLLIKMVKSVKNGADLSSTRVFSNNKYSFFEKILNERMYFQDRLFSNFNNGINVYTCHGVARIFSKKLYKNIVYQPKVGEDAYSYFYTITNNFKYRFIKNSEVFINVPNAISDHLKQGVRYINSQKEMAKIFGENIIIENYSIPYSVYFIEICNSILKSPIYFTLYILVNLYTRLCSFKKVSNNVLWDVAISSK